MDIYKEKMVEEEKEKENQQKVQTSPTPPNLYTPWGFQSLEG